jgi:o-succinylbenzoate synthase
VAVVELEVRLLSLPLVRPFTTSAGTTSARQVVVVRLRTPSAEGWGECAALPEPTYTSEYASGAFDVIERYLAPLLLATPGSSDPSAGLAALTPVQGHPMAKATIEMALLDAELRAAGTSLSDHLGGVRSRVPAGVAVGMTPSIAGLLDVVAGHLDEGYRRFKLKVAPGWDVEPLTAVRDLVGPDVALVADANGAYGRADIEHLGRLDDLGLLALEQPLATDDLDGHVALAGRLATPICLDESVTSAALAARALDLGATSMVSVKAGRLGGLAEAMRVHDVCRERGAPAWVGGMLETGIGRAAALALASTAGFTLPGDLSASNRYFAEDLTAPFELDGDGCLAVPTGPGLGVTVHLDRVEAHTVRRTRTGV